MDNRPLNYKGAHAILKFGSKIERRLPRQAMGPMGDTPCVMDTSTGGWEWALLTDITDKAQTEGEMAIPDNWTALNEIQEEKAGLVGGFPPPGPLNEWARKSHFIIWSDEHNALICRDPEPSEHGLCTFHIYRVSYPRLRVGVEARPQVRVLVRAIPTARLFGASLSETPSAIEIVFRNLSGDQVGEAATRSKEEGEFLMEDLVELAEEMAEQENLLTSVNQEVHVLLDGCHDQLPLTAVLWSASANQQRGLPHV